MLMRNARLRSLCIVASISNPTFLLFFFVFEIVEVYHTKMHPLFVSAMVATMMVTTTTLACPMENTEGVELPPFHLPVLDKDLYATPNGHVTDIAGGAFVVSGGGITETESNAPFGVRAKKRVAGKEINNDS